MKLEALNKAIHCMIKNKDITSVYFKSVGCEIFISRSTEQQPISTYACGFDITTAEECEDTVAANKSSKK